MARKEKFLNNSVYHVVNRGVDKRNIFLDDKDYLRFVNDLYVFNDINPAPDSYRNFYPDVGNREEEPRDKLVEILAFCLMPNHFHLLLKQVQEGGISLFMKKIGSGYANYFNKKYERSGTLFEGRFKAVNVERENHLIYLPFYIHFNPLDLFMPEWRKDKISDPKKAMKFLEGYRWSSLLDYLGKSNFPNLIDKDFLTEVIGSPENFRKLMVEWLEDFNLETISKVVLM